MVSNKKYERVSERENRYFNKCLSIEHFMLVQEEHMKQ